MQAAQPSGEGDCRPRRPLSQTDDHPMEHSSQGSGGCSGGYRSAPYNPGLTPFHVPLSYGAAAAQLQAAVQRAVDRGLPGHVLQALLRLLDSFGVTLRLTAVVPGLE